MSDFAIQVQALGKKYRIGSHAPYHRFTELLANAAKLPCKAVRDRLSKRQAISSPRPSEFWALRDVNFEIKPGEVVGVIGRNGAGKSTLLKLLSRITPPTEGRIRYRGRVGSLLEVGTGFHPELTGRDNIYLNGAILGMTRAEVRRKFDEIVAFSEVEKFLDTAVKHYSSGMYMRLAFAVAAHLEPEILLVDEVLAVGDAEFQKKCMGKMGEVAKGGRTVLFVSHNMGAVQRLCDTSLLLASGGLYAHGPTAEIIARYQQDDTFSGTGVWMNNQEPNPADEARFERLTLLDINNVSRNHFSTNEEIIIECVVNIHKHHPLLKVGFDLLRDSSLIFRSLHVDDPDFRHELSPGIHALRCRIPARMLSMGNYEVALHLSLHCIRSMTLPAEPVVRFGVDLSGTSPFHQVLTPQNHPALIFPILPWQSAGLQG